MPEYQKKEQISYKQHASRMQRGLENRARIKEYLNLDRTARQSRLSGRDERSELNRSKEQQLSGLMSLHQLPSAKAVQIASFEKFQPVLNEREKEREKEKKQRNITLDPVPSHIVAPARKPDPPVPQHGRQVITIGKMPSGTSLDSSYFSYSDSDYQSRLQIQRKIEDKKYSRAKKAAKKLYNDPSRDVLQGMLNPYPDLQDTSKRSPHPFTVEKTDTLILDDQAPVNRESLNPSLPLQISTPIDKSLRERLLQQEIQSAHEIAKLHSRREITVADIQRVHQGLLQQKSQSPYSRYSSKLTTSGVQTEFTDLAHVLGQQDSQLIRNNSSILRQNSLNSQLEENKEFQLPQLAPRQLNISSIPQTQRSHKKQETLERKLIGDTPVTVRVKEQINNLNQIASRGHQRHTNRQMIVSNIGSTGGTEQPLRQSRNQSSHRPTQQQHQQTMLQQHQANQPSIVAVVQGHHITATHNSINIQLRQAPEVDPAHEHREARDERTTVERKTSQNQRMDNTLHKFTPWE